MFSKPIKVGDSPVVYNSLPIEKKKNKSKNVIELVSGNKIKLQSSLPEEENVIQFIYTNSQEWFNGKNFSLDKIKNSFKVEYSVHQSTRVLNIVYEKEIKVEDLYKYCGSVASFVYHIDKIEIKGKDITLKISIDVVNIYKKDRLDKKCMIQDHHEPQSDSTEQSDSEVSDDELTADDEEYDSGDFFV
jgi:hypothetical protein